MESFVLKWPKEEDWKITHSSVEGDGRTIVFGLTPTKPNVAGERVMQLIRLPKEKPGLDDFFENWLDDFSRNQPNLNLEKIPFNLSYPSRLFLLKGLVMQAEPTSAIGLMVAGEQSMLLHMHLFPLEKVSEVILNRRLKLFNSLEIKPQSLEDSLVESTLLPAKTKTNHSKEVSRQSEVIPAYLQEFAHPRHPEDFPYWVISFDIMRKEMFWARILKEVGENLFVARALFEEDSPGFYLKWDTWRQAFVRISSEGLSLLPQLEISACTGCKFQTIDPVSIQKSAKSPTYITCPFCEGQIMISERNV